MIESNSRSWEVKKIGDCCNILDSQRIPLNSKERAKRKGKYPYFGANGIQDYIDDFIFDCEAILLAEDGGNFDQYAIRPIAQWVSGKYWVNNHAHILTSKGKILNKWIYYSLVHKNILKFINGGTRTKLNQSDLREIELTFPPLPEQKKIASILSSVDDVIEKIQLQINKHQDLKTSVMNELLTKGIGHTEFKDSKLGKIPKSWEIKTLKNLGECIRGLTYSPKNVSSKGLLVLRSSNIKDEEILLKDNVYVNLKIEEKYLSKKLDILICVRNGSRNLIGKSAIINENYTNFTHGAFMIIYRSKYNNFLQYLFKSNKFFDYVSKDIGATINSINTGNLLNYKFAIPTEKEQREIANILLSINNLILINKKKLKKYKSLKKSLMQDLLTGKVRVSVN